MPEMKKYLEENSVQRLTKEHLDRYIAEKGREKAKRISRRLYHNRVKSKHGRRSRPCVYGDAEYFVSVWHHPENGE